MTTGAQAPPAASSDPSPHIIEQADTPITEDHYVLGGGLRQVRVGRERRGRETELMATAFFSACSCSSSTPPLLSSPPPGPSLTHPSQVVPYLFDFKCTVKPRSEGATLVDFMASEFPAMPPAYYEEAVSSGRARAAAAGRGGAARPPRADRKRGSAGGDGAGPPPHPHRQQPLPLFTPLDPAAPLPHNACVRHLLHRHEPPALALRVPLLGSSGDLFAVGKPPGLPVHAAGGYRKNTVVGVLEAADRRAGAGGASSSYAPPRPVHRLDKPVSGVLVLARTAAAADAAAAAIARREVVKTYVARVVGAFPGSLGEALGGRGARGDLSLPPDARQAHLSPAEGGGLDGFGLPAGASPPAPSSSSFTLDLALGWDPATHTATLHRDGPRLAAEVAGARHQAAGGGRGAPKPAATAFTLLAGAPDGATSLVACRPLTGRSHQIRIHLAALGHPIANDATYGGPFPGPERPRLPAHGGAPAPTGGIAAGSDGPCVDDGSDAGVAAALAALTQCEWVGSVPGAGGEATEAAPAAPASPRPAPPPAPSAASALAACPFCPALARPWRPAELLPLWLHAARYVGPGWAFECPLPRWGESGWVPPPPPR